MADTPQFQAPAQPGRIARMGTFAKDQSMAHGKSLLVEGALSRGKTIGKFLGGPQLIYSGYTLMTASWKGGTYADIAEKVKNSLFLKDVGYALINNNATVGGMDHLGAYALIGMMVPSILTGLYTSTMENVAASQAKKAQPRAPPQQATEEQPQEGEVAQGEDGALMRRGEARPANNQGQEQEEMGYDEEELFRQEEAQRAAQEQEEPPAKSNFMNSFLEKVTGIPFATIGVQGGKTVIDKIPKYVAAYFAGTLMFKTDAMNLFSIWLNMNSAQGQQAIEALKQNVQSPVMGTALGLYAIYQGVRMYIAKNATSTAPAATQEPVPAAKAKATVETAKAELSQLIGFAENVYATDADAVSQEERWAMVDKINSAKEAMDGTDLGRITQETENMKKFLSFEERS